MYLSHEWCHKLVIPALWSLWQEDRKFKASLGHIGSPYSPQKVYLGLGVQLRGRMPK